MGRQFIRPVTQIKTLDTFDDQVAAAAAMETATFNQEQFLGGVISQLNRFLNTSVAGNDWYADLATPSTFENGAQRGIDETNQDLHDLERKRVLVDTYNLTDITVPALVKATGVLTAAANVNAGDTVTIGTKTYTYTSPLGAADGDVLVSAVSASDSLDNLIAAVTLGAGSGVTYAAATTANTDVTAAAGAGDTIDFEALLGGTQGNLVGTVESTSGVRLSWGAATLTGGTGDVIVFTAPQLPSNTTAAIGAVTTLGTVAAYNSDFADISLAEVSGSTDISPKNLAIIVDADTRDPILSSGRVIWALFQTESNTDGSTMTGVTPNQAMLSFVRINSDGDDLEFVPAVDIAGKEINYSSKTRKALQDLTEQDFLKGAEIDVPAASTVTRQAAYDNQGVTPVDVTTHSYLDLEGAGLVWQIRDDLQAMLFEVTEGSAGGTSQINIGSDVDEFDVDAAVNNFLQGVTVDSGGTAINVGVTAGQIDSAGQLILASGGAADLKLDSAAQLVFTDQWQAASTYATDLVLADTAAEWSAFDTAFGEVSLLNAIVQAAASDNRRRAAAAVTVTVAPNVLVEGPGGPGAGNLSVDLLDYTNVSSFVSDVEIFVNGVLQYNGANAAANNDVYPSAVPAEIAVGCFYCEYQLQASPGNPDVVQMFITGP